MINIFKIIFFISFGLQGQTSDQINQAKKIIKQTGMSESDARAAAKLGFGPKQIDKVIQAEKGKNTRKEKVDINVPKILAQSNLIYLVLQVVKKILILLMMGLRR